MKTYKVVASYTSYCMVEVEAEDEDQAWEIAKELDGGSFEIDDSKEGNWYITDVQEVDE